MRRLISFLVLLCLKCISALFYRFEIGWPANRIEWNNIRLIVFLNHTSLFEPIFLGFLPVSFLWQLSKKLAAPGADKTMNRPLVGTLFKLMSPGITSVTRKRDDTWEEFIGTILPDSIILIAPEGRMKRKNGLDLDGNKMTVRGGVADLIADLNEGQMILAYSRGLHHVQIPGEGFPKVFKTLKLNIDALQIAAYKSGFNELIGSSAWKKKLLDDLQHRLETKIPL